MSTENTDEGLKRVVGIPVLAATIVNLTIGAGIFALPALIGLQLGAASVIGYILCAAMFTTIVLCYVEIGSRVKTSGGSYAYVEAAFGPFAGFIINWLFIFGFGILSDAAIMNIAADSLSIVYPVLLNPLMKGLLLFILMGLMIQVNVLDSKNSFRFVQFVTVLKLLPLVALILFGFPHIQASNLSIHHLPTLKAFNDTSLILFFALAGFETSLNVSGEIKNPGRTVPRGILLGGILVMLIYILIQLVTQGVLGQHLIEFKDAPLAGVAEKIIGSTGATILLFAAVLSCLASVNGDVLSSPRVIFAGAKDGLFPKFLSKVHPKYATPYMAIVVYAAAIFIFSVSGGFKQLAVLASGALLLVYFAVILAMLKLRFRKDESVIKSFRVPGGYLVPGIAIIAIIYVLSNLSSQEMISISLFVGVLCLIYLAMNKWKSKPGNNPLYSEK